MLNKQTLTTATALFLSLSAVHIGLAKKPAAGGGNHMQRGIELAQQKHFDAAREPKRCSWLCKPRDGVSPGGKGCCGGGRSGGGLNQISVCNGGFCKIH